MVSNADRLDGLEMYNAQLHTSKVGNTVQYLPGNKAYWLLQIHICMLIQKYQLI